MQLYLLLIPRPIRNGASIKDGMLIRMKKVWNGNKLPAQVGQPTNSPLIAPTLPTKDTLLVFCAFSKLNA